MLLEKLLLKNEYLSNNSTAGIEISEICSDTSKIKKGCLFVCIKGGHADTHTMMRQIADGGASAVIVEQGCPYTRIPGLAVFEVPHSRTALAYAWDRMTGEVTKTLHMIGVTGTNGKSSTAYMIYRTLLMAGVRTGLIGTIYSMVGDEPYAIQEKSSDEADRLATMTTPDPDILYPMLADMKARGITHVVMEVSSHSLVYGKTAPIIFDIAAFTNLSAEHLDMHGTMEEYMNAKALLFRRCLTGIFNSDDEWSEKLISQSRCRIVRCTANDAKAAVYKAQSIQNRGMNGTGYICVSDCEKIAVDVKIPGRFSVYNSLIACAVCRCAGVSVKDVRRGISSVLCVPGRMEKLETAENEPCVIIDYAHTPQALKNLLMTVRECRNADQRIILVFGCGGDRDRTKRAPMGSIAEAYADLSIVTTDNCRTEDPEKIISDIICGFSSQRSYLRISDRREAIRCAVKTADRDDIILLVGKGHEDYQILGCKKTRFSEKDTVCLALCDRAEGKL